MSNATLPFKAVRPHENAARSLPASPRPAAPLRHPAATLRAAHRADLDALEMLERHTFTHDRISRRSFVRFLTSPRAALIVADAEGALCGYALVLFRARSERARLYSIAVDTEHTGRRIGSRLLGAAEDATVRRGSKAMRLEVREDNMPARNLYRAFGYRFIGRLAAYYPDGSDALRLQKLLDR